MILNKIPYDKEILYSDSYEYHGQRQRLYVKRSRFYDRDQYFFKSYILNNGSLICQGYIYFYLIDELRTSNFIGVYVKDEYRNNGIASFLVANWIQFCLNEGYDFLGTNKTQRKPFLLYLLKTYGFEIFDLNMYRTSNAVIHICEKTGDSAKYLLFNNKKQEKTFMSGSVVNGDNYKSIPALYPGYKYLDSVILSTPYGLADTFRADEKSTLVLNRNKR